MAKGTTHEKGITHSFFANPFGPLQQEDKARKLIDEFWNVLDDTKVDVGEVYTNLGLDDRTDESLKNAARAVLDLIQ